MSTTSYWSFVILCALSLLQITESLYCEPENCYNLLEVSSSASPEEIKKAFRVMAKRHHPDRNQVEDTTQLFQQINVAYEILDNENTRKAYDHFLRDPQGSRAYHTYQYYKASYSPQVNPFVVIIGLLLLLSWLQWVMRKQMHASAVESIINSEEFKIRVNKECEAEGKKKDKWYKEEVAERLQKEISIEGGYSKPEIKDLLVCRVVLLPITIVVGLGSVFRWVWKYYIKREDYDQKDQSEMTRKVLKVNKGQWDALEVDEKNKLISRRLWDKNNMLAYNKEMQQEWLENLKVTNPAKYRKVISHLRKTQ